MRLRPALNRNCACPLSAKRYCDECPLTPRETNDDPKVWGQIVLAPSEESTEFVGNAFAPQPLEPQNRWFSRQKPWFSWLSPPIWPSLPVSTLRTLLLPASPADTERSIPLLPIYRVVSSPSNNSLSSPRDPSRSPISEPVHHSGTSESHNRPTCAERRSRRSGKIQSDYHTHAQVR